MIDGVERLSCGAGAQRLSEEVFRGGALVAASVVRGSIGAAREAGSLLVAMVEGRGRQGFRTGRTRGLLGPAIGGRRPEAVKTAAACVSGGARAAVVPRAIIVGGLWGECLNREGFECSKGIV